MNTGLDKVLLGIQVLIFALSLFALFLGALGVLNVGVVTVRQRIREIGVRRALGASSRRIFAAVMLESVLATALAGLLGIALAIALVNNFPYEILPRELSVTEDVPFPVGAAVQAFVTATVIGALVGLVPATVAVRSRVIDAIRY
jgi:putative ABC transport system permease protein